MQQKPRIRPHTVKNDGIFEKYWKLQFPQEKTTYTFGEKTDNHKNIQQEKIYCLLAVNSEIGKTNPHTIRIHEEALEQKLKNLNIKLIKTSSPTGNYIHFNIPNLNRHFQNRENYQIEYAGDLDF